MGLNIKGKINGLVAQAATKVGISWMLAQIRAAAHGEYGPVWKARYDTASAAAPWTGLGLSLITAGLLADGQIEGAAWVGSVAGLLLAAGLINAAYLTEIPLALKNSPIYQRLVSWAPTTTVLLSSLWIALEACHDPQCAKFKLWVLVGDAIALKLGLVGAALDAKPPKPTVPSA